jgi:hypothetical protein
MIGEIFRQYTMEAVHMFPGGTYQEVAWGVRMKDYVGLEEEAWVCTGCRHDEAQAIADSLNAIRALSYRMAIPIGDVARFIENGALQFSVRIEGRGEDRTCAIEVTGAESMQIVCALGGFVNTGDAMENPDNEGEGCPAEWKITAKHKSPTMAIWARKKNAEAVELRRQGSPGHVTDNGKSSSDEQD